MGFALLTCVANSWIRSVLCKCLDRQLGNDACPTSNSERHESKSLALLWDAANNCKSLHDVWGLRSGDVSLMEYHLILPPWFCSFHGLFLFTGQEH